MTFRIETDRLFPRPLEPEDVEAHAAQCDLYGARL
jgi:hypothetical protein